MLSRAADNLYWMARYLERAENLARLVDANSQYVLDAGLSTGANESTGWQPVLEVTCLAEDYARAAADQPGLGILEFLTLSGRNNDSVRQCVALARENARMVRDQLSEEMWRELNRLHLFLQSPSARDMWEFASQDFYERITRFSLLFQGLVASTIERSEGFLFIQVGKYLERADKTTRILDIPTRFRPQLPVSPWPAVLRASSARSTYLSSRGATISEKEAVSLLLFDPGFPRSLRFCLNEIDAALHAISGTPRGSFANEAERVTGATLANVDFNGPRDLAQFGIHVYADRIQEQLNVIGQQIFETYVLLPAEITQVPGLSSLVQDFHLAQQQQQQ